MVALPETRYVEHGGVHLAYQTLGEGDRDVFYLSYPLAPIDLMWDDPLLARGLRRLAGIGRLITCDGRGWGSSDPVDQTNVPELQSWMDDIGGIAVHICARVAALARPDEVLTSGALPPLVVGSNIRFVDRGELELKGVPGTWRLFAVQ